MSTNRNRAKGKELDARRCSEYNKSGLQANSVNAEAILQTKMSKLKVINAYMVAKSLIIFHLSI